MSRRFKVLGGVVAVSFVALGVVALSAQFDHRAFDGSEETKAALLWMGNGNPSDQLSTILGRDAEHLLDKQDYAAVIDGKEKVAETMLASTSWVRLDERDAKVLTGYVRAANRKVPYLVRGLASNGSGSTRICVLPQGQIAVSGGALSHSPVRLRKQCFVAWLDSPPTSVWVSYGVAE